jgi:hypothetical protein
LTGLAWIEAFDQVKLTTLLADMRDLDLFSEQSIGHYFSIALRNKLWAIFGPDVAKPAPVRAAKGVKRKAQPKRPADQPARRMAA